MKLTVLITLLALGSSIPLTRAEDAESAAPDLLDWGYYYVGLGATALVSPESRGGAGTVAFRFHKLDPLDLHEVDADVALDLGATGNGRFTGDLAGRMSASKGIDWARFGRRGHCGLAGFVGAEGRAAAFSPGPRHSTKRVSFQIGMRAEPLALLCYGSRFYLMAGPIASARVGRGDGYLVAGGGGKLRIGASRVRFGAESEAAWSVEGLLTRWDGTLDVLVGRRLMIGARVSGERILRLEEPPKDIVRALADPDARERRHLEVGLTAGVAF